MKLIIGLGNPGSHYTKTRHNLGFMVLDRLANELTADWQDNEQFKSITAETQNAKEKILLAKPQTMMNLSGQTVKLLADYYKIEPENIWVVHDDIDLPLGVLRISQNSSSAGHKGIQSLIEKLNTKNFVRFRLGIHPVGQTFFTAFFKRLTSTKKFVLQKFSKAEATVVQEIISKSVRAILLALKEDLAQAKNQYN